MARVVLIFEDVGAEGDVQLSYEGDPEFDPLADTKHFTTAQLMAVRCISHLKEMADEDPDEELKGLPPAYERH